MEFRLYSSVIVLPSILRTGYRLSILTSYSPFDTAHPHHVSGCRRRRSEPCRQRRVDYPKAAKFPFRLFDRASSYTRYSQ